MSENNNRISPKSVALGDVIEYHSYLGNKEDPSKTPNVGLVHAISTSKDKSEVLGFQVLPLESKSRNFHVDKGDSFYLISFAPDIEDMGLSTDQVHCAQYKEKIIANHKDHLSPGVSGGVMRLGSVPDALFEKIMWHRDKVMGVGGPVDNSKNMEKIETYQMAERGKNLYKEKARQDHGNAEQESSHPTLDFPSS